MHKQLVTALFLALIAVPAFAAVIAFEEVDANKDGAISHAEATTAGISDEAFTQADVNKDKQLSPDEYKMFTEPKG